MYKEDAALALFLTPAVVPTAAYIQDNTELVQATASGQRDSWAWESFTSHVYQMAQMSTYNDDEHGTDEIT